MRREIELKDKFIKVIFETNRLKFQKLTGYSVDDYTNGMCSYTKDSRLVIIGVFNGSLDTLHHELYHAMESINILINESDECKFSESNAYLTTMLFNNFKKGLK